jgi:hypothetical protein
VKLTERDRLCLAYLDGLMEATAQMIGRHIWGAATKKGGSNLAGIGAAVAGRLRKRGLVARVPELNAWQITASGRRALSEAKEG